jgi:hypothetical protein
MYKAEHLHTSWAPYLGDIDIDRQGILTDKVGRGADGVDAMA